MDYKRSLYNIGLNGNGYLLTNIARKRPRIMSQSSVFGTRFAQGDRSYLDFNLWWYWAQSEWSNGFKDKVSWADDGKYYFSSNIDAFSKVGSLQLMKNIVLKNEFNDVAYHSLTCGLSVSNPFKFGGGTNQQYSFVGTDTSGGIVSRVYKMEEGTGVWTTLSLGDPTISMFISQILSKNNTLWILQTNGSGYPNATIQTFNSAGTKIDHSGYITTLLSESMELFTENIC